MNGLPLWVKLSAKKYTGDKKISCESDIGTILN